MRINKDFLGCFGKLPKRKKTIGVVIHHTCTTSPARTRSTLKSKGYSTHFEIDKDGTVYQYADLDRKCCHCGSNNHQMVGVDITHAKDAPWPEAQLRAANELFKWLSAQLDIPRICYEELPPGFYFHRAIGDTVCPQDFPKNVVYGEF